MSLRLTLPLVAVLAVSGCSLLGAPPTAEVGECLQYESVSGAEVTEIPTVDCTEEHDAQVVAVFEARDGDYPATQEEWDQITADGCLGAFEGFVGVGYADSDLALAPLTPNADAWEGGDREVLCVASLLEGTTTESFEGSGL